jgi:membrane associated rhomboid family serine protease
MKFTAVKVLVAANVLVFLLQGLANDWMEMVFALWPLQPIEGHVYFHPWQLITYAFLHDTGNISHIAFNMLGLWMFGSEIERYVGPRRLLTCYFASVFGLLLAYAMMFPTRKVVPLIPPIPMPAWLFATLYACIELFLGVTGTLSGIAHFAHLGGMVGSGFVVMQWRASARKSR